MPSSLPSFFPDLCTQERTKDDKKKIKKKKMMKKEIGREEGGRRGEKGVYLESRVAVR